MASPPASSPIPIPGATIRGTDERAGRVVETFTPDGQGQIPWDTLPETIFTPRQDEESLSDNNLPQGIMETTPLLESLGGSTIFQAGTQGEQIQVQHTTVYSAPTAQGQMAASASGDSVPDDHSDARGLFLGWLANFACCGCCGAGSI